ncbi:hypothetical protein P3T40_001661 [Paraburkholderia sp. EB58]|uniref:hypothetical protein n=1 Tax=Paraburkholderia sp. EB58 TaxID=3035125 RepID=UPI003D1F19D3
MILLHVGVAGRRLLMVSYGVCFFCRAARVVVGLGALLAVRVVGCFHAHVTHVCALRLVKESDYNGCGWFLLFCRLFMAIFGEMWGFLLFTIWFFRFSDQGLNVILIF